MLEIYDVKRLIGDDPLYCDRVRNYLRNKEIFEGTKMFSVEGNGE